MTEQGRGRRDGACRDAQSRGPHGQAGQLGQRLRVTLVAATFAACFHPDPAGQGQGGRSQPRTSGRDAAEGAQPTPGADEAQQQDPGDTPEPLDAHRLAQRQKQVDFGKNTLGYQRYLQLVPK